MSRWTAVALAICLCLSAPWFAVAQPAALSADSTAQDPVVSLSDTAQTAVTGALAAFGYGVYQALATVYRWVTDQLQPLARTFSRFLKKVFADHYDENTILRVPLSRRQ